MFECCTIKMRQIVTDKSIIVLQYNWEENLRKDDKAWVYHKKLGEKSLHGFTGDRVFNVVNQKQRSITICHVPTNRRSRFICPYEVFGNIHKKSVISLDVAEGGLGVSVSIDNQLIVWETEDGTPRRNLEGHLFDVYSCSLFPSGVVVLSGGADMLLKIFDAATGLCPVTLQGHTGTVNDTVIIEKGKNIISVSKDCTARLWNCAEAKCLATLLETDSEINCCCVIDVKNQLPLPGDNSMADELEFGTYGKLLAVGCDNGKVFLVSVLGREIIHVHHLDSPVRSLCWAKDLQLLAGLENGSIVAINPKEPSESPNLFCHDSNSPVICMKLFCEGVVISRRDGICQYYLFNGTNPAQFTGPDCDPVYSMATDKEFLYTACRDSLIRKYKIQDLTSVL